MKSLVVWLLLSFALGPTVHADSRTDQVDALFEKWDRRDSPGCALGIIENGRFVYQRGYGLANLEYDIPITTSSVFRTGSVSKQFAAMAILLAAEEGKLSMDDDIRKHIPELPQYDPPVTIRHMIHHTSGLRDYLVLMNLAGKRDEDYYTNEEVMERLVKQKRLNFAPGDEYLYSNTGYFLLSQIILRATGKTLREWAEEKMFEPLDMASTHFHDDPREIVKNRASGYRRREGGGFEIDMTSLEMVGDGGVFTTIDDLLKWDRNFYNNRLGGEAVMKQALNPGTLSSGEKQDYAFGLGVSQYRGLNIVEHGGSFVGFRAGMLRFPDQNFSIFCLCNLSEIEPMELARKIADIYLADPLPPEATSKVRLSEPLLQEKVGNYWNQRTAGFADVTLESGQLRLSRGGSDGYRLLAMDEQRFLAVRGLEKGEVRFEKGQGNGRMRMELQFEGQRRFELESVEPVSLTEGELEGYEGRFRCDELGMTYRVELGEEGKLILKMSPLPDRELVPVFRDGFRWELGSVVFERDSQGSVTGFRLQADRARNFHFVKRAPRQTQAGRR
jgi:CubicO group peptidase (beta-lactamase class C family)